MILDFATISQKLNKRFLAPLPEFYKRRIVDHGRNTLHQAFRRQEKFLNLFDLYKHFFMIK